MSVSVQPAARVARPSVTSPLVFGPVFASALDPVGSGCDEAEAPGVALAVLPVVVEAPVTVVEALPTGAEDGVDAGGVPTALRDTTVQVKSPLAAGGDKRTWAFQ
jgi:hypothetical protein